MPRKTPLGKIKDLTDSALDTALDTLKNPVGSAGKAVGQARGTVALGRQLAEQATRGASGVVLSRLPGRKQEPAAAPTPEPMPQPEPTPVAKKTPAVKKAPVKKAPAAKKAPVKKTDQNPIDARAAVDDVDATPADVAKKVARKAPAAKKSTAKKATATKAPTQASAKAPGDKLPTKKSAPAKKTAKSTAKSTAKKRPLSAEELAAGAGTETITPVGTRGADVASNPSTAETDLQQPGTEPLMDPATTNAVSSEAQTLSQASDPKKG